MEANADISALLSFNNWINHTSLILGQVPYAYDPLGSKIGQAEQGEHGVDYKYSRFADETNETNETKRGTLNIPLRLRGIVDFVKIKCLLVTGLRGFSSGKAGSQVGFEPRYSRHFPHLAVKH
jgi:hypothetical protein